MTFDRFKKEVFRLAKVEKKSHLIPDSNTLFVAWEEKRTPAEVLAEIPRTREIKPDSAL